MELSESAKDIIQVRIIYIAMFCLVTTWIGVMSEFRIFQNMISFIKELGNKQLFKILICKKYGSSIFTEALKDVHNQEQKIIKTGLTIYGMNVDLLITRDNK